MTENQGDSIVIQLASKPNINNASLSISVLPSGTLANNPNHNILSAFWLKPYVRGTIDKGHYYFSKGKTKRKNRDLDLLLLTQGWSKYSWKDSSKNETEEAYKRVSGFDIVGRVEGRRSRKEKTLLIRSEQESGFFEIVPINDDNSFKLENVHIEDSTALSFSLINEKKKEMRKPAVHFNIYPLKDDKNTSEIPEFTTLEESSSKATVPLEGFIGEAVVLDNVMLTTKKKIDERYGGDVPLIEQKIEITEKIGVIDWISNLRLDSRWKTELKVLNVLHPEMTLYIEGMNLDGVLFSEVLTVKTR